MLDRSLSHAWSRVPCISAERETYQLKDLYRICYLQGWRGGKSGRPLLGGGHLGAEPDASGEEFYRASPKEESEEAAVAAAAAALASPRAAAAPSSMAGTAAVQAAVGGASAGPASPTTLARQLELQTGPPPGLTVANMLVWRRASQS